MATPAQLAANQANAQHSTGPKTLEGKQRSAQNARRLGLFVSDTTLAREEAEELARLLANYTAQYCPDWEAEHQLVRQLALATLRQHRYAQAEAQLLSSDSGHSTAEQIEANERTFSSLLRAQAQADRLWHKAYTALEKASAKRLYTPRQTPKQLVLLQPEPNEPNSVLTPEPNEANSSSLPATHHSLLPLQPNKPNPESTPVSPLPSSLSPEPNEPNSVLGPASSLLTPPPTLPPPPKLR